ncbi:hypothetical protein [Coprobacter sp.]
MRKFKEKAYLCIDGIKEEGHELPSYQSCYPSKYLKHTKTPTLSVTMQGSYTFGRECIVLPREKALIPLFQLYILL